MLKALTVGLVKRFQLLRSTSIANKLMARQNDWFYSALEQRFCCSTADHINDHRACDGRNWSHSPFQPVQFEHAITRRRKIINYQIGAIHKFLTRRVRRLRRFTMSLREDSDHGQTAGLSSHGHFDNYRADAAGRNEDKSILWAEMKTTQNPIGVAVIILQVERGTQTI